MSFPQRSSRAEKFTEQGLFDDEIRLGEDPQLGTEDLFGGTEEVQVGGIGDVEWVCGFAGLFGVDGEVVGVTGGEVGC